MGIAAWSDPFGILVRSVLMEDQMNHFPFFVLDKNVICTATTVRKNVVSDYQRLDLRLAHGLNRQAVLFTPDGDDEIRTKFGFQSDLPGRAIPD